MSEVPDPPDEAELHEAALAYLARFAATEAGLLRVLNRRIARWARAQRGDPQAVTAAAAQAKQTAREVVVRLAASGALSDSDFALARARSLSRTGRSRRAILSHLAARGVEAELVRAVLPEDEERELAAALATARRRSFGPFRSAPPDSRSWARELAALARAGFRQDIARRALGLNRDEAEALIIALKRG